MARIETSIEIDCSPAELWDVVGDIGAMSTWFPGLTASSFSDGIRRCSMEGGGELVEEITVRDDDARRYEYRITQSPMPVEHHEASLTVTDEGAGRSRLTWITEVRPDHLATAMAPILDEGLRSLRAHLGSTERG